MSLSLIFSLTHSLYLPRWLSLSPSFIRYPSITHTFSLAPPSHYLSLTHSLSQSSPLSLVVSLRVTPPLSLSLMFISHSFVFSHSFVRLTPSFSLTHIRFLSLPHTLSLSLVALSQPLSLTHRPSHSLSLSESLLLSLSLMSLSHAYVLSLPHTLSLSLVASLSTPPRPGSLSHSPRSLSHLFSPTVSHTFCLTDTQTLTRSPPHTLPLLPPPLTPPVSYKVTPIVSPTHSFISLHSLSLFVPFSHTHCLSHSSPLSLLVASLTPFLSHCLVLSLTRSLSTAPTFVVSLSSVDLSFIINILTRYISLILSHCLPPPFHLVSRSLVSHTHCLAHSPPLTPLRTPPHTSSAHLRTPLHPLRRYPQKCPSFGSILGRVL